MKICVISECGSWGPFDTVCNSINHYTKHQATLVMREHDSYGFSSLSDSFAFFFHKDKEYSIRSIAEADCLLLFGLPTIERFIPEMLIKSRFWRKYGVSNPEKAVKSKKIIYFAGCSKLLSNNSYTNDLYKQWNIDVFFHTMELRDYVKVKAKKILPYLPPMPIGVFKKIRKSYKKDDERLILCHSPGAKFTKKDTKGTKSIIQCFENIKLKHKNISYSIIHGMSNKQCLKTKAKCHIFVDQLVDENLYNVSPPYMGGLGKSGIEGMLLGCASMTSYNNLCCEPYFPECTIIKIDSSNLEKTVEEFVLNKDLRIEVSRKQLEWASTYFSEEFFASYVFGHIGI